MPGAITRRTRSSKIVPANSKRGASIISNFARVSKPPASGSDFTIKIVSAKVEEGAEFSPVVPVASKKRKAGVNDENDSSPDQDASEKLRVAVSTSTPPRGAKRSCRRQLSTIQDNKQIPQSPRRSSVSTEDVDLLGAQPLLERLNLQASPSAPRARTRPAVSVSTQQQLPSALVDLLNLFASFTKTLAIHLAHNGTSVPVDIRAISPSVTQSWGKRKVSLDDIRRCVGVLVSLPTTGSPFGLVDYGRGKICVELLKPHASSLAIPDEPVLNSRFETNLRRLWAKASSSSAATTSTTADPVRFVATLPKAAITQSESLAKAGPALNKDQRTLEEFKNNIAAKRQADEGRKAQAQAQAQTTASSSSQQQQQQQPLLNSNGAPMSLIDRIRYKELLASQQSISAPSPVDLARRAALQRVPDVAAVVGMLSTASGTGQKRVSFSMAGVLSKLRDSLRVPISREEGAACVRLLAGEVAPQWIRVVTVGGRENVVVLTDFALSKVVVQERVAALLG